MKNARIASPARSEGANTTPLLYRSRHSRSVTSKANSSIRLSNIVDNFKKTNMDSFALSPSISRRSILSDNTEINEPRRNSWWKNLKDNSRDIMELFDNDIENNENCIVDNIVLEEDLSQHQNRQMLDITDSSGSESIHSIVIPHRPLFTQKEKQSHNKFGDVVGHRDTITKHQKTQIEDDKTMVAPRNLFNRGQKKRTRPIFPAALLNMSDINVANKTKDMTTVEVKQQPRNLFSNKAPGKRKNMFADFIATESEDEISDVQANVFAFKKTTKLSVKQRRTVDKESHVDKESSPSSSITSEAEMNNWKLLPSSTMVEQMMEEMFTDIATPVKKIRRSKISEMPDCEIQSKSECLNKTKSESKLKKNLQKSITGIENQDVEVHKKNHATNLSQAQEETNTNSSHNIDTNYALPVKENLLKNVKENEAVIQHIDNEVEDIKIIEEEAMGIDYEVSEVNDDLEITILEENEDVDDKQVVADENDKEMENIEIFDANEQDEDEIELANKMILEQNEDKQVAVDENDKEMENIEIFDANEQDEDEIQLANKMILEQNEDKQVAVDENDKEIENIEIFEAIEQDEDEIELAYETILEQNEYVEDKQVAVDENDKELENMEESDSDINDAIEQHEDEIELTYEGDDNEEIFEKNSQINVKEKLVEVLNENDKEIKNIEESDPQIEENEDIEQDEDELESENETEEQINKNQSDSKEAIDESQVDEQEIDNQGNNETGDGDEGVNESQEDEEDIVEHQSNDEIEQSDAEENKSINESNDNEADSENEYGEELEESEQIDDTDNTSNKGTDKTETKFNEESQLKSPEAILHNRTNKNLSFEATERRNTSARKTKNITHLSNIQPILAPTGRESTDHFGDGTKNSSAEGSGWDSHRTTRKTLRQTFGKDYASRKSLRALVMEKSAKRQTTNANEVTNAINSPNANSTEIYQPSITMSNVDQVDSEMESSPLPPPKKIQTTLEACLEKIKRDNAERRIKLTERVNKYLKPPTLNYEEQYKYKAISRATNSTTMKSKTQPKVNRALIKLGPIPEELVKALQYKPPKRFSPASWTTKRLYHYIETKLEPKYDYKARVRAEKFVEELYDFSKQIKKLKLAPTESINGLKHEMARLNIVDTHHEFYDFFHEFMPREIRIKVVPDAYNKLSLPADGVYSNILKDHV